MFGWSGPGIALNFFTPENPPGIARQTLESWLEQEHVPALQNTGGIKNAWLYKAADTKYDKQHVLVCEVPDLAEVEVREIQEVGRIAISQLYGSSSDQIEMDLRIYSFVQLYESSKHHADLAPTIMLAMMEPEEGGETDLDAWYREEHNQQMSEQPGWWRTTRFSLLHRQSTSGRMSERLSFLAVHEFGEVNQLGTEVRALEPMSDWTKQVMDDAKAIDAVIYHKQR